jgi:plastocyanin
LSARRGLTLLVAIAAVAVAPTLAQAANITITKIGATPTTTNINQNDSVTWTNTDTADHQLVSDKAGLAMPILHTGQSFTFTFTKDGNFSLKDALDKKLHAGSVVVAKLSTAPAQAANSSISLKSSAVQAVYGASVTLSGTVTNQKAGEKVTVEAQAYGANAFSKLADVTTVTGGAWSWTAKPTIRTVYVSKWGNKTSSQLTVGVRPLVSFRVLAAGGFSTKVVAARSFAGKYVQLQRRSASGQWLLVKRAQLNRSSATVIRASLPHGTSTLRVAFSVNQAGAGFLAGFSRTIVFHRA